MAIQKKKTTVVVQKNAKKATTKKSVPVKKAAAKSAAPAKKTPAKSTAAKKSVPAKPAAKKATGKAASAKPAANSKKPAAAKSASAKAPVKKAVATKKAAPKLISSKKITSANASKTSKEKPLKQDVKKAGQKKSPVTSKAATKTVAPAKNKKTATVAADKKTKEMAKAEKEKKVAKDTEPKSILDHRAEMKKALKEKNKDKEPKKAQKPFVMPKTNTEKARKYEPEFVKSVLDQSPEEYSGPTMRYSDAELTEFRDLITRKLETAKKELGYLQGLITRKDQMGGDESDNRYMTMEDGSLSMEREQLSQMASRQITFIDHLEKAMMRIENKTYGICRVTGKLIDKARLRAVPHATLSIEAKMGISK